jgi:hypothetical protein
MKHSIFCRERNSAIEAKVGCSGTKNESFVHFINSKEEKIIVRQASLNLPQAVGWSLLFFALDFAVLMAGRIITGIGSGLCSPASYIILSEYALVRYRGLR